jgi:hypothetical protein
MSQNEMRLKNRPTRSDGRTAAGLPDFYWRSKPKMEKYTPNWPQNAPKGHLLHLMGLKYQRTAKYTKIFHSKAF